MADVADRHVRRACATHGVPTAWDETGGVRGVDVHVAPAIGSPSREATGWEAEPAHPRMCLLRAAFTSPAFSICTM